MAGMNKRKVIVHVSGLEETKEQVTRVQNAIERLEKEFKSLDACEIVVTSQLDDRCVEEEN